MHIEAEAVEVVIVVVVVVEVVSAAVEGHDDEVAGWVTVITGEVLL